MTVTDVQTDTDKQTMTITAELPVPAERAWQLWSDPRQLERWWGPRRTRRRSLITTSTSGDA